MSYVLKCDKCVDEIPSDVCRYEIITVYLRDDYDNNKQIGTKRHLCDNCRAELENFMNDKPI